MKLLGLWTDGVIVQRGKPIPVAGFASAGAQVTVRLLRDHDGRTIGLSRLSAGAEGQFEVEFPALNGSVDTYTLTVEATNETPNDHDTVVVRDVVVGELWLAAGQSNMAIPAVECLDARETEAASVAAKDLTGSLVRYVASPGFDEERGVWTERPELPATALSYDGWRAADDQLSGVALSFAKELCRRLGVPVGIVSVAVGGTTIEAWLPRGSIEKSPALCRYLKQKGRYVATGEYNRAEGRNYTQMCGLYNEKIAPLSSLRIGGIIWQQGESSADDEREATYFRAALLELARSCSALFRDRRQLFIAAHIAAQNYQFSPYGVGYVNEAIGDVARKLPDRFIQVPIYDIPLDWVRPEESEGSHPIHPLVKVTDRTKNGSTGGTEVRVRRSQW